MWVVVHMWVTLNPNTQNKQKVQINWYLEFNMQNNIAEIEMWFR